MIKRFLLVAVLFAPPSSAPFRRRNSRKANGSSSLAAFPCISGKKYKTEPHDHWWANFVHAARIRTEQLRAELGENAMITWLVYKPGYLARSKQDGMDLIGNINSVRDAYHLNLVYFDNGGQVINYLNNGQPRSELKIAGFEVLRAFEQSLLHVRLQQRGRQLLKSMDARGRFEADRSPRLRQGGIREKLGLPYRRTNEPILVRRDRHPDVGRNR